MTGWGIDILTDFTQYKDLDTRSVTQISAKVIMRGLEFEEFTLLDKETVDGVLQALNNEKFIKADEPSADLSVIALYSGGNMLNSGRSKKLSPLFYLKNRLYRKNLWLNKKLQ